MACFPVTLSSLVIDGTTLDADGVLWTPKVLLGWFDGAPIDQARQPVLPVGEVITNARERARPIVLEALATSPQQNSTALGDDCYRAIERAKLAGRCIYAPVTITVTDPALGALHASVRRSGDQSLQVTILGALHAVRVQWLLLAQDPRRYEADNVTTHD